MTLAWTGLAISLISSAAMWASVFIFRTRLAPIRVVSIVTILACLVAVGLAVAAIVKLKAQRRWGALALAAAVLIASGVGVYMAYIVTILTLARGAGTP